MFSAGGGLAVNRRDERGGPLGPPEVNPVGRIDIKRILVRRYSPAGPLSLGADQRAGEHTARHWLCGHQGLASDSGNLPSTHAFVPFEHCNAWPPA